MSEHNNMEYYQGRALRERELARTSANASIARIHIEMAEHYEKIIARSQVEIQTPAARSGGR
jgi:hypothetical protein